MRNIGITTFVTLLMLGMAVIGSGHIALAHTRDFTNSGNYLVNNQNCTAGNTCNLRSSNTVTSGSSGLTSPPPSTAPTPTTLTLSVSPTGALELFGTLKTDTGSPIAGAAITFTDDHGFSISPAVTDANGNYLTMPGGIEGSTVTAHYAGAPEPLAFSDSAPVNIPH